MEVSLNSFIYTGVYIYRCIYIYIYIYIIYIYIIYIHIYGTIYNKLLLCNTLSSVTCVFCRQQPVGRVVAPHHCRVQQPDQVPG